MRAHSTRMKGEDVRDILIRHGQTGPAAALLGLSEQPDKTRGSVYASAQRMASRVTFFAAAG